MAWILFLM